MQPKQGVLTAQRLASPAAPLNWEELSPQLFQTTNQINMFNGKSKLFDGLKAPYFLTKKSDAPEPPCVAQDGAPKIAFSCLISG